MRLKFTVKFPLVILAAQGFLCAQSSFSPPRVGAVEYYGLRKLSPDRIQRVLGTRDGDPLPQSKGDVEDRLEKIPGVVRSHLEAVCCDDGKMVLFVGIEERGAAHFNFRTAPIGDVLLTSEIRDAYRQFLTALEAAAAAGSTDEDLTNGHSLMLDPDVRARQEQFLTIAAQSLPLLKNVLRNSVSEEDRAMAAYIIGYAPKKTEIVNDLQQAVQDPDDGVRNNAIRALNAIEIFASLHPDAGVQVPATWFVEMLNSVSWSDRSKAVAALMNLTEKRPELVLNLIRDRALLSLAEMARWKSLRYAVGPYTLLGRVAGLTDQQIEDTWTRGAREVVIARALKSGRK